MRNLFSVVIVLIILVMGFSSCKKRKLFGKKQVDTTQVWLARQESLRLADSIKKAQAELLAIEAARQDSIRMAEEAKRAFKYHIIVGSFITPEYARNLAEEYTTMGYNVQILPMPGGRFELVSAEAFDTFRPAVDKLEYYQENILYEAWLYIDN